MLELLVRWCVRKQLCPSRPHIAAGPHWREHGKSRREHMQKILDYAATKLGFEETHAAPYPELVFGTAPGMLQAVLWVFRLEAFLTMAEGPFSRVVDSFEREPLRAMESDVLGRQPVGAGWRIEAVVVRPYRSVGLSRVTAIGEGGEASILFEAKEVDTQLLESIRDAAIGKSLREVVELISSVERGQS
jgi:hypothetical protein